ncbi:MAG TPA: enoyl-CoA hydratase [Candidatus Angelobacter sp.]|nr:enoyl-CoA hydratase [Candidatus Angelobacter sp.]
MSPAATSAAATSANEPLLLRDNDRGIVTLTLNRPRQYNALSDALLGELQSQLDAIASDGAVRIVIIAGAGQAFCAGHDLKEMRTRPDQAYYGDLFRRCSRMMLTITQMPQPVIARVHGIATAAGCQLVAACDLAVASPEARFATSGINVGLFCSTPAVALSRNVSEKQAFEMLMTGDFIDADTALRYGLVNRVVPAGELDAAVTDLAHRIAGKSAVAVATGKRLFYRQRELGLSAAYELAAETMACNMMAEDVGEGIDAFMQKRPPVWKGR